MGIYIPGTDDLEFIDMRVTDVKNRVSALEANPPGSPASGNLTCSELLNSGPFLADAKQHIRPWVPPRTIRIKSTRVWIGVDMGCKCDVLGYIVRASDHSYVNPWGWDHYADPTAPHVSDKSFGNDYMEVSKDDSLLCIYQCNPMGGQGPFHAHVAMWAWYL